ncbi:threonine efflux system, partial [Acinetobacter soli]
MKLSRIYWAEPYRVCRRVNILRDYPDDKTKLYPR